MAEFLFWDVFLFQTENDTPVKDLLSLSCASRRLFYMCEYFINKRVVFCAGYGRWRFKMHDSPSSVKLCMQNTLGDARSIPKNVSDLEMIGNVRQIYEIDASDVFFGTKPVIKNFASCVLADVKFTSRLDSVTSLTFTDAFYWLERIAPNVRVLKLNGGSFVDALVIPASVEVLHIKRWTTRMFLVDDVRSTDSPEYNRRCDLIPHKLHLPSGLQEMKLYLPDYKGILPVFPKSIRRLAVTFEKFKSALAVDSLPNLTSVKFVELCYGMTANKSPIAHSPLPPSVEHVDLKVRQVSKSFDVFSKGSITVMKINSRKTPPDTFPPGMRVLQWFNFGNELFPISIPNGVICVKLMQLIVVCLPETVKNISARDCITRSHNISQNLSFIFSNYNEVYATINPSACGKRRRASSNEKSQKTMRCSSKLEEEEEDRAGLEKVEEEAEHLNFAPEPSGATLLGVAIFDSVDLEFGAFYNFQCFESIIWLRLETVRITLAYVLPKNLQVLKFVNCEVSLSVRIPKSVKKYSFISSIIINCAPSNCEHDANPLHLPDTTTNVTVSEYALRYLPEHNSVNNKAKVLKIYRRPQSMPYMSTLIPSPSNSHLRFKHGLVPACRLDTLPPTVKFVCVNCKEVDDRFQEMVQRSGWDVTVTSRKKCKRLLAGDNFKTIQRINTKQCLEDNIWHLHMTRA